jgi:PAS domain S-box-containing protein
VDNRTDAILYCNHRFCEIWEIEHLEDRMQRGELNNNDILPECLSMLADVSAFTQSCQPLQSEANRSVVEDEILFADGRMIRRFSAQIRDEDDRYFGRLYIFEDVTERKQREVVLRNIAEGVAAHTGKAFLDSLVQSLTRALGVEYAFIGEVIGLGGKHIRTIAGYRDGHAGQVIENFEYDLTHAPCGQVVGKQFQVYPRQVQQLFPLDRYLQEIGAESYMGIPLFDSAGRALGLIAVLSRRPLENSQLLEEILKIFAARVSSELERQRSEAELQRQTQRSQLFAEVALKIRQSLQLNAILQTTVTEIQKLLQSDRVVIFQLHADGSGTVVQEAVVAGWPVTLGQDIVDPCFQAGYLEQYRQGRIGAVTDIQTAGIEPCYIEFLQQLAVQANLVVPILVRQDLWGLLIAHQCSGSRQWTDFELELLSQLSNQIGIALAQSQLLAQEVQQRQALAQSQAELQSMSNALASAVEGISQLDAQGRYTYVNQAYARMMGYLPEELIGLEWPVTVHPEDRAKVAVAYQQMRLRGKAEVEARAIRKDGSVFDKQVVLVQADDPPQQVVGHYCFMKDISDRREIERLKDEFISVVSHELRTPLTSIAGALDLLASGVLQTQPTEAQRMIKIAANNTERLVRLINDILDIERIESGKVTMTKQVCDAASLMTQAVEGVQDLAEPANITLSMHPVAARLWADPDRIVQVFTNLLSNAIKFSPPGSTVEITAAVREVCADDVATGAGPVSSREIWFQVRDQGRGIPPEHLESIFERFQQVDASDSRQRGGTGLGLAICRSILQYHGGRIWAESTLGAGSTFFFTLPVLWEVTEATPTLAHTNTPLVLECDDDSSVRTVICALLERQGYRVIAAASGQEAIEKAVQYHPSAILLNLMMPGMDGWETLAILKQQAETQKIPVIILSGLSPDARKIPYPGVNEWLVKPPDPKRLRQSLEQVLAAPNQLLQVLVVEDDLDLAQVIMTLFNRHGIATTHARTGTEAMHVSQQMIPDLVVLDVGLPECDGFAVVDWLRQHQRLCRVPLVIYTAHDLDERDRERLRLEQTLFLTKGRISPPEFEQRVVSLLNRIIHSKTAEDQHETQTHSDHR